MYIKKIALVTLMCLSLLKHPVVAEESANVGEVDNNLLDEITELAIDADPVTLTEVYQSELDVLSQQVSPNATYYFEGVRQSIMEKKDFLILKCLVDGCLVNISDQINVFYTLLDGSLQLFKTLDLTTYRRPGNQALIDLGGLLPDRNILGRHERYLSSYLSKLHIERIQGSTTEVVHIANPWIPSGVVSINFFEKILPSEYAFYDYDFDFRSENYKKMMGSLLPGGSNQYTIVSKAGVKTAVVYSPNGTVREDASAWYKEIPASGYSQYGQAMSENTRIKVDAGMGKILGKTLIINFASSWEKPVGRIVTFGNAGSGFYMIVNKSEIEFGFNSTKVRVPSFFRGNGDTLVLSFMHKYKKSGEISLCMIKTPGAPPETECISVPASELSVAASRQLVIGGAGFKGEVIKRVRLVDLPMTLDGTSSTHMHFNQFPEQSVGNKLSNATHFMSLMSSNGIPALDTVYTRDDNRVLVPVFTPANGIIETSKMSGYFNLYLKRLDNQNHLVDLMYIHGVDAPSSHHIQPERKNAGSEKYIRASYSVPVEPLNPWGVMLIKTFYGWDSTIRSSTGKTADFKPINRSFSLRIGEYGVYGPPGYFYTSSDSSKLIIKRNGTAFQAIGKGAVVVKILDASGNLIKQDSIIIRGCDYGSANVYGTCDDYISWRSPTVSCEEYCGLKYGFKGLDAAQAVSPLMSEIDSNQLMCVTAAERSLGSRVLDEPVYILPDIWKFSPYFATRPVLMDEVTKTTQAQYMPGCVVHYKYCDTTSCKFLPVNEWEKIGLKEQRVHFRYCNCMESVP